jgi:4-carboxymuconolactone decarboxylase
MIVATEEEKYAYLNKILADRGHVTDYHKLLAAADFELLRQTNEMIDAAYLAEGTLSRRVKELIFIHGLVVTRAGKFHVEGHIRLALNLGASPQEILESIEMALPQAGVAVFREGFEAWCEVVGIQGLDPFIGSHDVGDSIE